MVSDCGDGYSFIFQLGNFLKKYIFLFHCLQLITFLKQGCGCGSLSGSGLDPDSIGSVDPDPDSESGSGSNRPKMTHKSRNFFKVHVLKCLMASFES
jgi:hypothetical protein